MPCAASTAGRENAAARPSQAAPSASAMPAMTAARAPRRATGDASGAQHLPRPGAGHDAILVRHMAVDDGAVDAVRWHDEALAAARQVGAAHRPLVGADAVGIEDDDVGGEPRLEPAAIADAEEIGGLRSEAHDRVLERHPL